MDVIKRLRKKVDDIDREILKMLNSRVETARKIFEKKKEKGMEIYQPWRHKEVLKKLLKEDRGFLSREQIENVFREIFSVCLASQGPLRISYLGPEGTFTHQAAVKKFGKSTDYINCGNIQEIFHMVSCGEVNLGVVPIENSIEGIVSHTLDMFIDSDLKICAEILMRIHLCLLSRARSIKTLKKVYSHPQVFAQARTWIDEHLQGVSLFPCSSTSSGASLAKKERNAGCIGSKILADIYRLNILRKDIQDHLHNITRFLVISKYDSRPTGEDKTSVLFSIKDRPGALYDSLRPFRKYNINLTKIESRPSRRRPWEYFFFVDFQGHHSDSLVKKALRELERVTFFVKILGSYPWEKNEV